MTHRSRSTVTHPLSKRVYNVGRLWYDSNMTTTQEYQQAAQAATLPTAARSGEHWTQADLDALHTRSATIAEAAVTLGRTYYAAASAARHTDELRERAQQHATNRRVLPYDRGWTSLADMGY